MDVETFVKGLCSNCIKRGLNCPETNISERADQGTCYGFQRKIKERESMTREQTPEVTALKEKIADTQGKIKDVKGKIKEKRADIKKIRDEITALKVVRGDLRKEVKEFRKQIKNR